MSIIINLSWLNSAQSNKVKLHWAAKNKHTKAERSYAYCKTKALDITPEQKALLFEATAIDITITFQSTNLKIDKKNMPASDTLKAYLHGIAEALGVSDRIFNPTYIFDAVEPTYIFDAVEPTHIFRAVKKSGRVNIEILI